MLMVFFSFHGQTDIANESSIFSKVLDSSGSSGGTPNHSPDSPSARLVDVSKSPRPSKFNFNSGKISFSASFVPKTSFQP